MTLAQLAGVRLLVHIFSCPRESDKFPTTLAFRQTVGRIPTVQFNPHESQQLAWLSPDKSSHLVEHRNALDLDQRVGLEEAADLKERHRRIVAAKIAAVNL